MKNETVVSGETNWWGLKERSMNIRTSDPVGIACRRGRKKRGKKDDPNPAERTRVKKKKEAARKRARTPREKRATINTQTKKGGRVGVQKAGAPDRCVCVGFAIYSGAIGTDFHSLPETHCLSYTPCSIAGR